MVDFGLGRLRVWFVAGRGERKYVKMRRNCESKSGFTLSH